MFKPLHFLYRIAKTNVFNFFNFLNFKIKNNGHKD